MSGGFSVVDKGDNGRYLSKDYKPKVDSMIRPTLPDKGRPSQTSHSTSLGSGKVRDLDTQTTYLTPLLRLQRSPPSAALNRSTPASWTRSRRYLQQELPHVMTWPSHSQHVNLQVHYWPSTQPFFRTTTRDKTTASSANFRVSS